MAEVQLVVNGSIYGGWTSLRITRGIEQISGTFELDVTERWPDQIQARPIRTGDACRVLVDRQTVITGYVDDANPSYDDSSHTLSLSGRDKTGDLVDCSAIHKTGQWRDQGMAQIAKDLCQPFGIAVRASVDTGKPFRKFALQEGESVFEALDRAARLRGLLLITDGSGNLLISRAGSTRLGMALSEGENILSASGQFSGRDRFSQYIVKGQRAGDDDSDAKSTNQARGTATDTGVRRHRPLIVLAEDQADGGSASERAAWERNVRIGRGQRVSISVQGWAHAQGLWAPNVLVRVRSPWLGVDADLLITSVTFALDSGGTRTDLELCPRAAFDVIPPTEKEGTAW